jgi:uncharacterized protein
MNISKLSQSQILGCTSSFERYLAKDINWDDRLIVITGARGTGKTTLMLQYIKNNYGISEKALYASLDNIVFSKFNLSSVAEDFYINGGRHLFVDEVHRYPNWANEVKNIYDTYPQMRVVVSGSSAIQIHRASADLSRRAAIYHLHNLSLREFIAMKYGLIINPIDIDDIVSNHQSIAIDVVKQVDSIIPIFREYLLGGAYPFYLESKAKFYQRLNSVINVIIEMDLMSVEQFNYSTTVSIKKILAFIADSVPIKPNIAELSRKTGVSRDVLLKLISLLEQADVLLLLRESSGPTSYLTKPQKIYLNNTALCYALSLSSEPEMGTLREVFFANQVSKGHLLTSHPKCDFLINDQYALEVGGKNKTTRQIQGVNNSYIAMDNIEVGFNNAIPLWLFGFLY